MNDFRDTLDAILAARDRERSLPPFGHPDRPYQLVVPGWMADLCEEQGETAQQVADRIFRVATEVTVVR